jgi:hypothetical protein
MAGGAELVNSWPTNNLASTQRIIVYIARNAKCKQILSYVKHKNLHSVITVWQNMYFMLL